LTLQRLYNHGLPPAGKARQRSLRPNAAGNGEPYPGTGIDRWGCFLPDLTRFTT